MGPALAGGPARTAAGEAARLKLTGLGSSGGRPDDDLLRPADWAAGNLLYLIKLVAARACGSGLTEAGAPT
jgi:hypothetical protein